jgi:hypothetical protein
MSNNKIYNTNLASEYYILSQLHRVGKDAYLTLGNKKSVDILIETQKRTISLDVKGIAGSTNWPLDNFKKKHKNHYIVLVSYLSKIENLQILPEIYIVPSIKIEDYFYINPKGNRKVVKLSEMRSNGKKYRDNWNQLK